MKKIPQIFTINCLLGFILAVIIGSALNTHAQNPPATTADPAPVLTPDSVIAIQKLQIAVLSKQNQAKDLALQYSQVQADSQSLQKQLADQIEQALKDAKADPAKWQVDAQQMRIIPRPQPNPIKKP